MDICPRTGKTLLQRGGVLRIVPVREVNRASMRHSEGHLALERAQASTYPPLHVPRGFASERYPTPVGFSHQRGIQSCLDNTKDVLRHLLAANRAAEVPSRRRTSTLPKSLDLGGPRLSQWLETLHLMGLLHLSRCGDGKVGVLILPCAAR